MNVDLSKLGGYLARHVSTGLVILGLVWAVGKPHAQQFIEDTVDSRLSAVETGQSATQADVADVKQDVETLQQQIQLQRREQDADTNKIICILEQRETC